MVIIIILLAVILFTGEKTSETQGFIVSMPFTRKEIILNKWLVGVLSILISLVVAYIFLSLFYVANIGGLDTALNPYSDIVKWFFIDTFQYICIFTFMVLVQVVMGNSIVSGIVGGIILEVPYYITSVVQEIIMQNSKYSWNDFRVLAFQRVEGWLNIYAYNGTKQKWFNLQHNDATDMYQTYYYTDYGLKLFVLSILTCLFLYLAYIAYKKRNLEYNLRLVVFKSLEPVLIWGIAICLGLLAGITFGFGSSNESLSAFWIWTGVFTIIGYFVSKLLIKMFSAK